MSKLPAVRARDLVRVAESLGFVLDRQRGSHAVYYRVSDHRRIVVPMHPGKDCCKRSSDCRRYLKEGKLPRRKPSRQT